MMPLWPTLAQVGREDASNSLKIVINVRLRHPSKSIDRVNV